MSGIKFLALNVTIHTHRTQSRFPTMEKSYELQPVICGTVQRRIRRKSQRAFESADLTRFSQRKQDADVDVVIEADSDATLPKDK